MNAIVYPPKPFSWSYSRLKNFETCAKRSWHLDIKKDVREEESEQLAEGNAVHKALELALSRGTDLPPGMGHLEKWLDKLRSAEAQGWKIYTEQKLAIDRDFGPCGYFDRKAWFRGKVDVLAVKGSHALLIDWKTGRPVEDTPQLALMAACVFSHMRGIHKAQAEFVWLRDDERTARSYTRDDMPGFWADMLPRVAAMEEAHKTTSYPAKPGRLCAMWCPITACPHHGQRY